MKIELFVRKYHRMIGQARYTACLLDALSRAGLEYTLVEPAYPPIVQAAHQLLKPLKYDVKTFFTTFPVSAPFSKHSLKHFTVQQMASMLYFRRDLTHTIITVHDIVPYLVRDDRSQSTFRHPFDRIFDEIAVKSLSRADLLIAISEHTKQVLVETLDLPPEKIRVVLYGMDHDTFKPRAVTDEFRARFGLDEQHKYILYVGSENPRKNLPRLVQAFARVRAEIPNVKLLKVGTPDYLPEFEALRRLIAGLGLNDDVLFFDHPSQEDLATFYNAADIFAFPSLYEGFGLPPLEAMACGTPVVCSNAASLPEVVGEAGILFDPYNVEEMAEAMLKILTTPGMQLQLKEKSLAWASKFTWDRNAQETIQVYQELME